MIWKRLPGGSSVDSVAVAEGNGAEDSLQKWFFSHMSSASGFLGFYHHMASYSLRFLTEW
jgi:hypothetical protein